MLAQFAKFSKLPVVSSLVSSNYPQEEVDKAIAEMKQLGKETLTEENELKNIHIILNHMKRFSESVQIQRVGCHALSNLAMQVMASQWIIQKGGFQLIRRCVERFITDHKLCWLASSAIWNLARPPTNRIIIGAPGVNLMMRILKSHKDREKVTNTAVGALSNLSLCDDLKDLVSDSKNLDLILAVLVQHLHLRSESVMTSGAGLLANLAVSDDHATTLVQKRVLPILIQLLKWEVAEDDETLHRNTCAGLNNLVTANGFTKQALEAKGIETIFQFLERNTNDMFRNLLDNCLVHLQTDARNETTSFHVCCLMGELDILKILVQEDPSFDLNSKNAEEETCLDVAIRCNFPTMVAFLARCGATAHSHTQVQLNKEIVNAFRQGTKTLKSSETQKKTAIRDALKHFPTDVCDFILTWESRVDLLKGAGEF